METNDQRLDRHQANGESAGHRRELSSIVLMGIALTGAFLAVLLLSLVN